MKGKIGITIEILKMNLRSDFSWRCPPRYVDNMVERRVSAKKTVTMFPFESSGLSFVRSTMIPSAVEFTNPKHVLMKILERIALARPLAQNPIITHPKEVKMENMMRFGFLLYPHIYSVSDVNPYRGFRIHT
jgi:hypothetical protein